MGQTISSHGVTHRVGVGGGGRPGKPEEEKERDLLKAGLGGRIEDKLQVLFTRTERLVTENRVQVLAVTHALETHKTLTGEDIEAVIEGVQGPLIDGRDYGTAEFAEVAEAYHAAVVTAHAEHGKVSVPLPKLNGQGDATGELAELTPEGIVVDDDADPQPPETAPSGGPAQPAPQVKKNGSKKNGKNGSKKKGGSKKGAAKKRSDPGASG
jgi:hypothetical protein